jgi:hypothetical protein
MRFALSPQTHLDKLKVAAVYCSFRGWLRTVGWSSFGWGLFTVVIGLLIKPRSVLDYFWLGLGAFLLLEGVWLLRSPDVNPKPLLLESTALLLLASPATSKKMEVIAGKQLRQQSPTCCLRAPDALSGRRSKEKLALSRETLACSTAAFGKQNRGQDGASMPD